MSKLQDKFSAKLPPGWVEEPSKPLAGEIVLNVARIEMVEQIEDSHANANGHAFFPEVKQHRARHLEIEGRKAWESIYVARSDIFAVLIFDRVGKPGVQVVNRSNRQVP